MTEIMGANWKLKSLSISYQDYGDYKGKYIGKITFENREDEAFMFKLSPEDTQKYISLISEKLVESASHLGDKLLASLNLLPAPKMFEVTARPEAELIEVVKQEPEKKDEIPF